MFGPTFTSFGGLQPLHFFSFFFITYFILLANFRQFLVLSSNLSHKGEGQTDENLCVKYWIYCLGALPTSSRISLGPGNNWGQVHKHIHHLTTIQLENINCFKEFLRNTKTCCEINCGQTLCHSGTLLPSFWLFCKALCKQKCFIFECMAWICLGFEVIVENLNFF